MGIKIIADSTNDLSAELLEKYNIRRLPLTVVMGDIEYKDGIDIRPRDIFSFVGSGKGSSHTAAINYGEYRSVYEEELAGGAEAIIHFIISGELSSCYDTAASVAAGMDGVYPIDTRSLSTGGGWLVLYAAELAQSGMKASEIYQLCEQKKQLVSTSFILDTLEFMRKGGRCSGFTAVSANALKIKPCLEMQGGKLVPTKKYRGSMKKVCEQYLNDQLKDRSDLDLSRIFVTHTFYEDADFVQWAVDKVASLQPFEEILITEAGCSIATHCGPDTIGVLFSRK